MARREGKTCFVTVGATASFSSLIKAVLSHDVCRALETYGYRTLKIQYGQGGAELFQNSLQALGDSVSQLTISGFDLDRAGLETYMREAKGVGSLEGVVISHAGSGTILDALRMAIPLIVVPNEDLLDNHQVELAEALAEQEYVVHGKLTNLASALQDAEVLRQRQKAWPPPNSGPQAKGLKNVLDEELGLLD